MWEKPWVPKGEFQQREENAAIIALSCAIIVPIAIALGSLIVGTICWGAIELSAKGFRSFKKALS